MARSMTRRTFAALAGVAAAGALAGCAGGQVAEEALAEPRLAFGRQAAQGLEAAKAAANAVIERNGIAPEDNTAIDTSAADVRLSLSRRVLVVYYSRPGENSYGTGNFVDMERGYTSLVADMVAGQLGCPAFAIQPADPYPWSFLETVERNYAEQQADARPGIANLWELPDLAEFDTLLVGTPLWNVRPPMLFGTLLESLDLAGKTIVPFTTYDMSVYGRAVRDFREYAPEATVRDEVLAIEEEDVEPNGPGMVADWLRRLGLLD